VVSLFVAAFAFQQAATRQAPPAETVLWKSVEPSVVALVRNGETVGVAALIHDSGLFLAHSSAVGRPGVQTPGKQVRGRLASGTETNFLVVTSDEQTQLTLLRALYWEPGTRRVLKVSGHPATPNVELLAVTVAGPKSGEFVADGRAGLMRPSLRYVPLSEVRMEGTDEHLGGAFVFDSKGDIVGVLGAALATEEMQKSVSDQAAGFGGGGLSGAVRNALNTFGPGNQTVAYALGREVLQRVVAGFVSPSHEVQHPTIGIFFKSNPGGRGVLVESVMSGSPSAIAGIHAGDVITQVDGQAVNSPIELAALLFRKNVGESVKVQYSRGERTSVTDVKVVSGHDELRR